MSATRKVSDLKTFTYIMEVNPVLLKDQDELDLSAVNELPMEVFEKLVSVLKSGRCKPFRLVMPKADPAGKSRINLDDHIKALANGMTSGTFPNNMELNFEYSGFWFNNTGTPIIDALMTDRGPKGLILNVARNTNHNLLAPVAKLLENGSYPSNFYLNLKNTSLKDSDLLELVSGLRSDACKRPIYINLDENSFTNEGALALLATLQNSNCNLSLNISINNNTTPLDPTLLDEIKLQIQKNEDLLKCITYQNYLKIGKVPQDVATEIYEFILPKQEALGIRFFKNKYVQPIDPPKIEQTKTKASKSCCLVM